MEAGIKTIQFADIDGKREGKYERIIGQFLRAFGPEQTAGMLLDDFGKTGTEGARNGLERAIKKLGADARIIRRGRKLYLVRKSAYDAWKGRPNET
ncbi:MAG: hypothetical protein J6X53_07905 [Abditibacteriota bacterium]|nr:hypothetical protein [Abditibacteriota bacterium]